MKEFYTGITTTIKSPRSDIVSQKRRGFKESLRSVFMVLFYVRGRKLRTKFSFVAFTRCFFLKEKTAKRRLFDTLNNVFNDIFGSIFNQRTILCLCKLLSPFYIVTKKVTLLLFLYYNLFLQILSI